MGKRGAAKAAAPEKRQRKFDNVFVKQMIEKIDQYENSCVDSGKFALQLVQD